MKKQGIATKGGNDKKNKKKRIRSIIVSIILTGIIVAGVVIIGYPLVSEWWNERHASKAISTYVDYIQNADRSEIDAMFEAARKYNQDLNKGFNISKEASEDPEYYKILDITGTGIMGYIQIPSINVNLPIYHGTDESVLQIAIGHIPGTSFPIGGKGTHTVVSGHRGLPTAKLFTDLDQVVEGDTFTFTVMDQTITYMVDQIHIVLPEDVMDLAIDADKDYATLITCTPYGINTHRMLVRGHRIDNIDDHEVIVTSDARRISPYIVFFGIVIPLILIAMIVSGILSGGRKKSQAKILEELENSFATKGGKDDETQ